MKKFNYLMMAAAMTLGLASCSQETKPGTPVEDNTNVEGNLIIKEINVGGGYKKDAGGNYNNVKAVVLYNNSSKAVTYSNLAIANVAPGNAHATNANYDENGKLYYEDKGWTPAWSQIWYIPSITVQPFSDAVVSINGAIDHTTISSEAFSLANEEYYAMYDPEAGFTNANFYPTPYEGIPTSHYWKVINLFTSTAWPGSMMSPCYILFQFPADVEPKTYCNKEGENIYYDGGKPDRIGSNINVMIPNEWIIDGVEFYRIGYVDDSKKRLSSSIDAGYGLYNSNKQYSAYRNIDEKATVNFGDNIYKLVYNYADGVEGTTDPSGIDAAASAKNGAKIIYQDTNNSTADFHLRKGWSLK